MGDFNKAYGSIKIYNNSKQSNNNNLSNNKGFIFIAKVLLLIFLSNNNFDSLYILYVASKKTSIVFRNKLMNKINKKLVKVYIYFW